MMIAPLALGALLLSGSASLGSPLPQTPGLGSPVLDPRSPLVVPRSPLPLATFSPSSHLIPRELLPRDSNGVSRCASHLTRDRKLKYEEHFKSHRKAYKLAAPAEPPVLNVHFHVVYANETLDGGYVPEEQLNDQVAALNTAYNSTGISWKLSNITRTQNQDWFEKVGPDEKQQKEMKEKLRVGEAKDLNVYLVSFKEGSGKGLLGYSTFPSDYEGNPKDDGVVMQFGTLPGGKTPNYNLGKTLVHEGGHWLGLYHTFQGGCEGEGDMVDDTPPEASAASGCPKGRRTCPKTGLDDPTTNFMDYVFDTCMDNFTSGQATRIADQLRTYRGVVM